VDVLCPAPDVHGRTLRGMYALTCGLSGKIMRSAIEGTRTRSR
jgi:hypothetical protein